MCGGGGEGAFLLSTISLGGTIFCFAFRLLSHQCSRSSLFAAEASRAALYFAAGFGLRGVGSFKHAAIQYEDFAEGMSDLGSSKSSESHFVQAWGFVPCRNPTPGL